MKRIVILFSALLLLAVVIVGCHSVGSGDGTGTDSETSLPELENIYTIVRAVKSSQEELDATIRLAKELKALGYTIEIKDDWIPRDADVDEHRNAHEILVGKTNRRESTVSYEALKLDTRDMLDYALRSDNEDYIIAAAPNCLDTAIDAFLAMVVDDLTRLEKAPIETSILMAHKFPLEDIVISGVSIQDYQAIVYEADYSSDMIDDVVALSDVIFGACGVRIPIEKAGNAYEGNVIRIGEGVDAEVKAGGDFSYVMLPSADGLRLEGRDVWSDWCAMDAFMTVIKNGFETGGTLAIDEPVKRITDSSKDDPLAMLQIAGWVISAADMTTEAQFAEVADCGFNQLIINEPDAPGMLHDYCKWMAKYQIRAMWSVSEANFWGWQNNGNKFLTQHETTFVKGKVCIFTIS